MGAVDKAARLRLRAVAVGAAGQPVRAARLLHRALALLGSAPPSQQTVAVHARVLASLAYFEAERGEVDAGLRLLDEADRLAATIDDLNVRGNLHLQRGSILVRRGSMDEALSHLDSAVALLDGSDQCVTLLNRSALHLYRGDLAAADADLRQCVATAALHGLGVLYAKARFNLGHLAYRRGDLPAALRDIDAALHDPLLTSALHAIALGGRAEALRAAGLTREADADLAEAVVIFRRERLTHDLGEALLARTQVALLERRWSDALRYSRQAGRQFARRGNTVWADLAELDGLQARLGLGRTLAAVAASATDLAGRLRATGLTEDARVASLVAARAHLALGDPTAAATVAGAPSGTGGSAVRLTDGDRIGTRLLARLVRAELAGARGDRVRREAELRGGLADVHRHQAGFGSLDLQTASAMHGSRLAELGIADAVRDGRPSVVFSWSERARALTARLPSVRPPDDPRAAEMLADLRGVRTALRAAELAGQRVPELRRRRAQLERQVRQRAWSTAGPAEVERPVSLAAVRAALGDGCLVVYLTVGGVLHALVARSRSAGLVRLSGLGPATATLQRVRADLDAAALTILPPPMREVVLRTLTGGLRRLDEALWLPIAGVTGDGPVVIVPTAALGAVPWTLLPSLRGRPLAVTPSATSWLAARARPPVDGAPVFAVGPGVPRGDAEVQAAARAWSTPLDDPTGGPTVLMGRDASSGAVLAAAQRARLLHVAAHGVHEADNPLFSSIQLADGPLFGYDLPRAAALPTHVVLSACDLGLAEVRPGDEALGMTSALLHGGVASVVAGVARVGDEVAGTAMVAYHRALAAGHSPAVALASAMADLDPATPAPLVCFGAAW
jgi:tetratricopeptide (TPR) repeat protein